MDRNDLGTVYVLDSDRCDRCTAKAFTVFIKNGMPLYFCNHHTVSFWNGLHESGFDLAGDIRNTLD